MVPLQQNEVLELNVVLPHVGGKQQDASFNGQTVVPLQQNSVVLSNDTPPQVGGGGKQQAKLSAAHSLVALQQKLLLGK